MLLEIRKTIHSNHWIIDRNYVLVGKMERKNNLNNKNPQGNLKSVYKTTPSSVLTDHGCFGCVHTERRRLSARKHICPQAAIWRCIHLLQPAARSLQPGACSQEPAARSQHTDTSYWVVSRSSTVWALVRRCNFPWIMFHSKFGFSIPNKVINLLG